MKFFLVTLLSLLVVSCGTSSMKSDDFASLSKYERARLVCSSTDSHQARANQLSVLSEQIDTQNAILKSGMRRWTSCRMVNESECAICTPKLVNRCTDGAVPIDSTYEAKVRDDYVSRYESIKSVHDAEMKRCSQLVLQMPVSEAYGLYRSGLDPVGTPASMADTTSTKPSAVSPVVVQSTSIPAAVEQSSEPSIVGTYRLEYTDYANRASVFRAFPEGLGGLKWVEIDGVYQFYYRSGDDTELKYAFTINPMDGSLLTFRSDQVRPKWNATARKISDSPNAEFDLFELGRNQGDSQYRCFNVGHAERPYATQPLSNTVTTTADTVVACEALCPSVVAWRESRGYASALSDCP